MEHLLFFLKSWAIGFAITAPFDPCEIFCIKRTIEWGFKGALLVGLGATLATTFYSIIAAVGVSGLPNRFLVTSSILKLSGGLLLLYLAYKEIKTRNTVDPEATTLKTHTLLGILIQSFFFGIMNPVAIVSFFSIFSSLTQNNHSLSQASIIVLGFFVGSMTWWCMLGAITIHLKNKLSFSWLMYIKIVSGIIFACFGIVAIISAILDLK